LHSTILFIHAWNIELQNSQPQYKNHDPFKVLINQHYDIARLERLDPQND